mgnify:CR=1 FL=1
MTAKRITVFVLLAMMLGLAGCESIGERLQAKFTPEPPRVKLFTAEYEQVFDATKLVLSEMGYRSIRGRVSSRKLTAVGRVNTNDALSGASQISVKVEFVETMPGETEMQVWLTEVVEDQFTQSGGYGTQMPIRGDLLYNMLFRGVELALSPTP